MTLLMKAPIADILSESLVGILIVFLALTLLVFAFILSARINTHRAKKRSVQSGKSKEEARALDVDTTTAISLALHLYLSAEIHDEESNILTIKRIQRRYSPWSSKIYSINHFQ